MSKPWNNRDKLLKKSIDDSLDGRTEMGAETQSGHGGPRLSMEARQRLEFAEGVVGMTYLIGPEQSHQTEVVVRILTTLEW